MPEFSPIETLPQLIQRADANVPESSRRLARLFQRYPTRWVWAGFVFVNCFISIAIIAFTASLSRTVFIFPSLGATAFLFFYRPMDAVASPRNAVMAHSIAIVCGYLALLLFGLNTHPAISIEGIQFARIFCAGMALATTCALMILLNAPHAPAASTALLVALGVVSNPLDLIVIELAVVFLAIQGNIINRAEGIDFPFWRARPH